MFPNLGCLLITDLSQLVSIPAVTDIPRWRLAEIRQNGIISSPLKSKLIFRILVFFRLQKMGPQNLGMYCLVAVLMLQNGVNIRSWLRIYTSRTARKRTLLCSKSLLQRM